MATVGILLLHPPPLLHLLTSELLKVLAQALKVFCKAETLLEFILEPHVCVLVTLAPLKSQATTLLLVASPWNRSRALAIDQVHVVDKVKVARVAPHRNLDSVFFECCKSLILLQVCVSNIFNIRFRSIFDWFFDQVYSSLKRPAPTALRSGFPNFDVYHLYISLACTRWVHESHKAGGSDAAVAPIPKKSADKGFPKGRNLLEANDVRML